MTGVSPIRVLVVDDSLLTRRVLAAALESAPDVTVVGTAGSGAECLDLIPRLQPHVITLDVEMPRMDGLEVLHEIMARAPLPVVMVSYLTQSGADTTVRAMLAGAVDVVAKPGGPIVRDLAGLRDELLRKVRAASRARPRVPGAGRTRLARPSAPGAASPRPSAPGAASPHVSAPTPAPHRPQPRSEPRLTRERFSRLVVLGASTGGPQALEVVMQGLPADRQTAYILVQHMPAGMTTVLAELLDARSALAVREARDHDCLEAGTALLAPGDFHLRLGPGGMVQLDQGPKVRYVRPSIDVTLLSAAELYGSQTVAAILTGIGADGADGAAAIHAAGGAVIAEDRSTCVVWGMPKAVAERGVATAVVPLPAVAQTIVRTLQTTTAGRVRLHA